MGRRQADGLQAVRRAWLADIHVDGRWMLADGSSWLMAVPCLSSAGTGKPRQVGGFSWQKAAILCLHGCKWQVSCGWQMAVGCWQGC